MYARRDARVGGRKLDSVGASNLLRTSSLLSATMASTKMELMNDIPMIPPIKSRGRLAIPKIYRARNART